MRFGSVCSGIEAASAAWNPLGWKASWLAEIEPFPCAVLAHHYPNTPNFGDMTQFESWPDDEQHAIDLLCGGTPCQSFSVAGLRKGLDDARGNLMLTFAAIAAKYRPKWLVWENVPGVLSSNGGRDFASFLGLLSGQIIEVPKEGWGNSGIITGYKNAYSLAYRVLDAQYFGVAQRRKRVFVVGCLGANRSAAAVLFERHSLSGDIAPSREKGKSIANCLTAGAFTGGASGRPEGSAENHFTPTIIDRAAFNQGANALYEPLIEQSETMPTIVARGPHAVLQGTARMVAFGEYVEDNTASTIKQRDYKDATDLVTYGIPGNWIGRKPENGGNAVEPMHNVAPCLTKTDRHGVAAYALAGNTIGRKPENGGNGNGYSEDVGYTLTKTDVHAVAYAFDSLSSNSMKSSNPESGCNLVDVAKTIDTSGLNPACNQGGNAVLSPIAWSEELTASVDCAGTMLRGGQGGRHDGVMTTEMQVRRLTPRECERLQGFVDDYTNIPWRTFQEAAKKGLSYEGLLNSRGMTLRGPSTEECPDGPRYKALGNSWAVVVATWLGKRIEMVEALHG